ncbi:non-ribosomal peptide synthetase [Gloeothece verrucosa]|uniref:Amino acid adenylation domain protein n=1 Tax=Gloeothece verrucosa (strain PCC 7822) TaxID=497965 RepID=E0UL38_GLOV7|nr:non-ribosomal peptide synthetase [Gloeothece verrucosa]ADN17668.1 amino acid adenylation domain protein [Gloeothece verrucosa PCC 7822]
MVQKYSEIKENTILNNEEFSTNNYSSLSFAQERIWFLEELEPHSTSHNLLQPFELKGKINQTALEKSLEEIIQRHEILRTIFILKDEKPVQVVIPAFSVEIPLIDISHLSKPEQEHQTQEIIAQELAEKFDLTSAPLLRLKLIRLSASEHLLFLTIHHIIFDGWSYNLFLKELEELYKAFVSQKSPNLPQLGIQYRDYAIKQKDESELKKLKPKMDYWKDHLKGNLPILQLPTNYTRLAERRYPSSRQPLQLSSSLTQKLKKISFEEKVTPFMTLLAALKSLLYRYTNQEDIIIGTPTAGRHRKDSRDLLGCFINTLALRTDLSGNPSFQEILRRVRKVSLGAFSNAEMPFEKLVEELKPERELTITPVFQVLFLFHNTPMLRLELPELTVTPLDIQRGTASFDLMVEIKENSEGLTVWFEYDPDLFAPDTMERMANHFETLLTGIVDNPSQPIIDLPLLTQTEQDQLLTEWNNTHKDYLLDQAIHQIVEAQVAKTPQATAVTFNQQSLTYQELNTRANQIAHYLQSLGIGSGSLVGLCLERSPEMIIGLLGILKAGAAYVPLDPAYPQDRLKYMLSNSQAEVLLTQSKFVSQLGEIDTKIVCLDKNSALISVAAKTNPISQVTPENLTYVIYTSGSTGQPKGVAMTQIALSNLIKWQLENTKVTSGGKTLQFAPISFDVSFQEIFSTLGSGGTLVLITDEIRRDSRALWSFLKKENINRLFLPFVALQQLAEIAQESDQVPQHLQEIITSGEQLQINPAITHLFQKLNNCSLYNQYGPSESHVVTSYKLPDSVEQWSPLPAIGRPIANSQIYLLDQKYQPVPIGIPGELYIGGVCLAQGYINRPDLTQQKFIEHTFSDGFKTRLYKTGDLARYLPDGNIEYLGRIDNQVKIRGFRIELGEIEALIAQYSDIKEAVVLAREDLAGNKRLVAYIIPHQQKENLIAELRRFLKETLPEYMLPSSFVILDAFPLTPSGKLDRRSLPDPEPIKNQVQESFVSPRNDLEKQLAAMWEQVLGLPSVSIKDNFFDIGGHSLIAVRLFAQIEKIFQIKLPLSTLFKAPTIEELAAIIEESGEVDPWDSLVLLKSGNPKKPALFLIHEADGKVVLYLNLANRLKTDQAVYGLRPHSQKEFPCLETRFKDMAAHYIEKIRTVQPKGPYFLGGLCAGGILAYEVAVQLQTLGETVSLVALIDAPDIQAALNRKINSKRLNRLSNIVSESQSLTIPNRVAFLFKEITKKVKNVIGYEISNRTKKLNNQLKIRLYRFYLENQLSVPSWLRNIGVRKILEFDAEYYIPSTFEGKVTLFRATQTITIDDPTIDDTPYVEISDEPVFGWDKRAKQGVIVYDIAGGHSSCLQEPYVKDLAQKLQNCLNATGANSNHV